MASGADATLVNSLIVRGELGVNCSGGFTTARHNLSSDDSCSFGNRLGWDSLDPQLGEYGDHGGGTLSVELLAGSPAIDVGSAAACPSVDQRGRPRPAGRGCDLGAFELQPLPALTGYLRGLVVPNEARIRVSPDGGSTSPDWLGYYRTQALPSGTYTVTPSAEGFRFRPSLAQVVVDSSEVAQDFQAYAVNSLAAEHVGTSDWQVVFAGESETGYVLESSVDLNHWTPFATNRTDLGGILLVPVSGSVNSTGRVFLRMVTKAL